MATGRAKKITNADWRRPKPFSKVSPGPFLAECLPDVLRDYVLAVAEDTQAPVNMAAVCGLAVMGLFSQGKFKVRIKGSWEEPLNLYSVIVASPTGRKSPITRLMTKCISDFEVEKNLELAPPQIIEQKHVRECIEAEISALKKDKQALQNFNTIKQLQNDMDALPKITEMRLIADDITSEQLVTLMSQNNERMVIISSEGGIFDVISGRYSDGKVNMEVYLKSLSGDTLKVGRRGRTETLHNPRLTMLLTIQPKVLNELISNPTFRGRGLTARFLYCMPKSFLGKRKCCYS